MGFIEFAKEILINGAYVVGGFFLWMFSLVFFDMGNIGMLIGIAVWIFGLIMIMYGMKKFVGKTTV